MHIFIWKVAQLMYFFKSCTINRFFFHSVFDFQSLFFCLLQKHLAYAVITRDVIFPASKQALLHVFQTVYNARRKLPLASILLAARPHGQGAQLVHHQRRYAVVPAPWDDRNIIIGIGVYVLSSTALFIVVVAVFIHASADFLALSIFQGVRFWALSIQAQETQSAEKQSKCNLHGFSVLGL